MNEIEIRPLPHLSDLHPIEPLERAIWGMDDVEMISTHTLHAMVHSGGQILGAFVEEKMVGFVVSIVGLMPIDAAHTTAVARLKLYSVIAGVAPGYQNANVGYRLKLAQREFALAQGIPLITWTYDPLESRNARFNIGKLGCVCHTYHPDFHGQMSGINVGIPTDRFEVEWWVDSEHVREKVGEKRPLTRQQAVQQGAILLNPTTPNADGLPVFTEASRPGDASTVLVEIPANYQAIKQQNFSLAKQWRQETGQLFEILFRQGYTVTDFVSEVDNGIRRSFYLLTKHQF
jgi:predicted GNAT superfamily acetyltransferase